MIHWTTSFDARIFSISSLIKNEDIKKKMTKSSIFFRKTDVISFHHNWRKHWTNNNADFNENILKVQLHIEYFKGAESSVFIWLLLCKFHNMHRNEDNYENIFMDFNKHSL